MTFAPSLAAADLAEATIPPVAEPRDRGDTSLRLRDLIPPHLRPSVGRAPSDEAAFAAFAADLTHQLGVLAAGAMLAATLLWWPLDRWVMPDARHVEAFARLRWGAAVIELGAIVVLLSVTPRPGRSTAIAATLYALLMADFGYALGTLRPLDPTAPGASWSHLAWFANASMGMMPLMFLPMRLRTRVVVTTAAALALALAFFAPFPTNLQAPGAWGQWTFLAFAVGFSMFGGELWQHLTRWTFFERRALDRANEDLAQLSRSLSDQVAERTGKLRALARHLDHVQESERRRIAHDLHDDLGQHLTAMRYALVRLHEQIPGDAGGAEMVEDLSALLEGTTRSMHAVVSRLRPRVLDDLGLGPALEWLCEDIEARTGVPCTLTLGEGLTAPRERLSPAVELLLFRAVQESATNALKHASPTRLVVEVAMDADGVCATVTDDGRGFDTTAATAGFGLLGLTERVSDLHGTLTVRSAHGEGTTVRAFVPTARAA